MDILYCKKMSINDAILALYPDSQGHFSAFPGTIGMHPNLRVVILFGSQ